MKKILIGGSRLEISKLFELLLWQPDRHFASAETAEQCLAMARKSLPDLIVVDIGIADLLECHELIVNLKSVPEIADKPLLLVTDPQQNNPVFTSLLELVDGVLPEPFNPKEIKSTTEQYI